MASIYLSSTLLWGSSPEEMFQLAYQSGLSGIELWAQHFFYQKYNAEEYRKLAALYPLRGCVHSQSWDLNLASLNDGIRTQSIAEVKKSIDLARRLDLEEVTVHPGHRTIPGAGEPYREYLRESLKEILEYAEKLGLIYLWKSWRSCPRNLPPLWKLWNRSAARCLTGLSTPWTLPTVTALRRL